MLSKILGILVLQAIFINVATEQIISWPRADDDPRVFIARRASRLVVSIAFCSGTHR